MLMSIFSGRTKLSGSLKAGGRTNDEDIHMIKRISRQNVGNVNWICHLFAYNKIWKERCEQKGNFSLQTEFGEYFERQKYDLL